MSKEEPANKAPVPASAPPAPGSQTPAAPAAPAPATAPTPAPAAAPSQAEQPPKPPSWLRTKFKYAHIFLFM